MLKKVLVTLIVRIKSIAYLLFIGMSMTAFAHDTLEIADGGRHCGTTKRNGYTHHCHVDKDGVEYRYIDLNHNGDFEEGPPGIGDVGDFFPLPTETTRSVEQTQLESSNQGTTPPSEESLPSEPSPQSDPSSEQSTQLPTEESSISTIRSVNENLQKRTPVDAVKSVGIESMIPATPVLEPLIITEYMLRDWSKSGGGGLPQWIEIYNPNPEDVNMDGYNFTYAQRKFVDSPWDYEADNSITKLTIRAHKTGLIATKETDIYPWCISGISKEYVWVIPHNKRGIQLKNGWEIKDPDGNIIHKIGKAFKEYGDSDEWDGPLRGRRLPPHTEKGFRVSFERERYPSEKPDDEYYYGNLNDVGSPGFYKAAVPAAPSLQRPKLITTWGHLKRREN